MNNHTQDSEELLQRMRYELQFAMEKLGWPQSDKPDNYVIKTDKMDLSVSLAGDGKPLIEVVGHTKEGVEIARGQGPDLQEALKSFKEDLRISLMDKPGILYGTEVEPIGLRG